jgi:hypothetical protein
MILNPVIHELCGWLRLIGMRDRLRCPECKAVGTWKPHGGYFDFDDTRKVRRWMCKWCGYYVGPEQEHAVVVSQQTKHWALKSDCPEGITPKEAVTENPLTRGAFPWRG